MGTLPTVARWLAHMGEEPPLSGSRGSGTIFFSGCSLRCLFCQNFAISQQRQGEEVSLERLVDIMVTLQASGCHNINLVSPTPYVPLLAVAIDTARTRGLNIPIIYNSHGYDTTEALSCLQGRVDIFLPDMKYTDNKIAAMLSGASHYVETNLAALQTMFSQVGHLHEDPETGLATQGMMVRILVLPDNLEGAKAALDCLKKNFSIELSISLMAQYAPLYQAHLHPPLDRILKKNEYEEIVDYALELGFEHLWLQEPQSAFTGIPDFSEKDPFVF